jgi:hypothetical protein
MMSSSVASGLMNSGFRSVPANRWVITKPEFAAGLVVAQVEMFVNIWP